MTSNIGSHEILEAQQRAESPDEVRRVVLAELRRRFRPEFLNRVDDIVVFHALTRHHVARILEIQLGRLRTRLADRRISLQLTPEASLDLAERGYDPAFGARPLKRLIQQEIETPIARLLVKGELRDGDTATVEVKDDKIEVIPTVEAKPA
jgi:ATP-dependent Clp protease ATP-binding subunit ClpB